MHDHEIVTLQVERQVLVRQRCAIQQNAVVRSAHCDGERVHDAALDANEVVFDRACLQCQIHGIDFQAKLIGERKAKSNREGRR